MDGKFYCFFRGFSYLAALSASVLMDVLEVFGMHSLLELMGKLSTKPFGKVITMREEFDPITRERETKVILAIPSFGCEHYFLAGGCNMCGFNHEIESYHLRSLHPMAISVLTRLFLYALKNELVRRESAPRTLCVFMAGSFFNCRELPASARDKIIDFFTGSDFQKIMVESRPEYIVGSRKIIEEAVFMARGKIVEILIGLESSNDWVRNCLAKKRMKTETYKEAIRTISEAGAKSGTYILIGSPFADSGETEDQSVSSAEFAWRSGSDAVYLEIYCVQEGTEWERLYRNGALRIPTLKEVFRVIRRIDRISSRWQVGEFADWPQPIAMPKGCGVCHDAAMDALKELRLFHSTECLSGLGKCAC